MMQPQPDRALSDRELLLQMLEHEQPGELTLSARVYHNHASLWPRFTGKGWRLTVENHGQPCMRLVPA
jgi:hypothetical protein